MSRMSDKPKRPWFRFHLLTAVFAMLLTGGLLGLNFVDWPGHQTEWKYPEDDIAIEPRPLHRGFPLAYKEFLSAGTWAHWTLKSIPINIAACLLLIVFLAALFEWLIRRREGRKP